MECTQYLISDRERRLKLALKYYKKSEEDLEESVSIIVNWLVSEKCFPEIPHRNVIKNFLLMNKFIIPNCKEKIRMYYSIRTIMPEFFQNKNPSASHMQQCMDRIFYTPLPKVTEEGYRVCIIKVVDDNPNHFKLYNFFAHTFNISEIRLHEDVAIGDILVYDFGNLKLGHFLKMTPVILRKTSIILEKVYSNRVKQIHFINTPQYASTTIAVIKQVMKAKMASRVKVHTSSNHLCKYVSVNILPTDYGGTEKTLFELNELWKAKLLEYKERFDALDNMKICGELIPLKNDEFLGFHVFKMKSNYFDPISEQTEVNIWKCFGKSKNEVEKDIEAVKIWLESQPHLPKYLNDRQIQSFLIIGRGSVEKIKPKIDMYFTMRTTFSDIFKDSHPSSQRIMEAKRFIYLLPLPTLCKLYSRTLVFKVKEVADPHNIDFPAVFAYLINMVDVRLLEDFCSGHTVVFDLQHCTLAHCANMTPVFIKHAYTVGEKALTTRVHGVHMINAPKYVEKVLFLVKSIIKPKLASKIYLHKDKQSFLDSVDKNILPKDYGGNGKYLDELEDEFSKKYEEYKSFFDLRETFKVNEDLRPTKNVNDEILGFYGNFKKLDVD